MNCTIHEIGYIYYLLLNLLGNLLRFPCYQNVTGGKISQKTFSFIFHKLFVHYIFIFPSKKYVAARMESGEICKNVVMQKWCVTGLACVFYRIIL